MSTILILLSSHFPYQMGEEFLIEETYHYEKIDKCYIIPVSAWNFENSKPYDSEKCEVIKLNKKKTTFISKLLGCICSVAKKEVLGEAKYLLSTNRFSLQSLRQLLVFSYESDQKARLLKEKLSPIFAEPGNNKVILYSYWQSINVKASLKLKEQFPNVDIKVVSRCHGNDLYEYRYRSNYLPFKREILRKSDAIYSISDNGKEYLEQRYPDVKANIQVLRLGTKQRKSVSPCILPRSDVLRIATCSYCRKLKRINLLIEALAGLTIKVDWVHIGGGDELENLKKEAAEKLGPNITYHFMGYMDNSQIMNEYEKEKFHLFINISETEGVPVSLMEAMSFKMPVIATAVGGVPEMIKPEFNGYLLPKNFEISELQNYISEFQTMEQEKYLAMSEASWSMWNEKYNADINYESFVRNIMAL